MISAKTEIRVVSHEFDDRRKDLEHIQSVIDNPFKRKRAHRDAQKAKDGILRQLGDKTLRELRQRLIKATRAGDDRGQWKIASLIKEHMHEPLPLKPTNQI